MKNRIKHVEHSLYYIDVKCYCENKEPGKSKNIVCGRFEQFTWASRCGKNNVCKGATDAIDVKHKDKLCVMGKFNYYSH